MTDSTNKRVPLHEVHQEAFIRSIDGENLFALPDDLFYMFMGLFNQHLANNELYEFLADSDAYDGDWESPKPCMVCRKEEFFISAGIISICSYECARSLLPEKVVHGLMQHTSRTKQWKRWTYVNVMRVNMHLCVRENERRLELDREEAEPNSEVHHE